MNPEVEMLWQPLRFFDLGVLEVQSSWQAELIVNLMEVRNVADAALCESASPSFVAGTPLLEVQISWPFLNLKVQSSW